MASIKKFLKSSAVHLIEKMLDMVKATPKMYNQSSFPEPVDGGVCDTPFCAAGHIVLAKSPTKFAKLCKLQVTKGVDWQREACKALGIQTGEIIASRLFGTADSWPQKYEEEYYLFGDYKTQKAQANQRVRAFTAYWKSLIETDMAYPRGVTDADGGY